MAKKNDLSGLISTITGRPEPPAGDVQPVETTNSAGTGATADTAGVGGVSEPAPRAAAAVRATFVVDPRQMRKIRYIAVARDCSIKEVVAAAFAREIADFEDANGAISLPE